MAQRLTMVIDLNSCTNCQACVVSCSNANETPFWTGKGRTQVTDQLKGRQREFIPRLCQQCEDAPCERVCPTGATYRDASGVVKVEQEDCIGCKACMAACPYGARYVYDAEDLQHARARWGDILRVKNPHVDKCDLCASRRSGGLEPACVATCMGQARIFGDPNDPNSPVYKLYEKAVPVGPEYGTKPAVRYIRKAGRS